VSHRIEPILYSSVQSDSFQPSQYLEVDYGSSNEAATNFTSALEKPADVNYMSVQVGIEELRGLSSPSCTNAYQLYVFCTCTVCYTEEISSVTSSFGSGSYISSPQSFDGNIINWNEPGFIQLFVPTKITESCPTFLRNTVLKVNLHLRSKFVSPFIDSASVNVQQELRIGDQVLGTAIVDLAPLTHGFPFICGWYEVFDNFQKSIAFVKVRISLSADGLILVSAHNDENDQAVASIDDDVTPSSVVEDLNAQLQKLKESIELSAPCEIVVPPVLDMTSSSFNFSERSSSQISSSPYSSLNDSRFEDEDVKINPDLDSASSSVQDSSSQSVFSKGSLHAGDISDASVALSNSMLSMLDSYLNVDNVFCSPSGTPGKSQPVSVIFEEDDENNDSPYDADDSSKQNPILSTSMAVYLCSDSSDELGEDQFMNSSALISEISVGAPILSARISEDIFDNSDIDTSISENIVPDLEFENIVHEIDAFTDDALADSGVLLLNSSNVIPGAALPYNSDTAAVTDLDRAPSVYEVVSHDVFEPTVFKAINNTPDEEYDEFIAQKNIVEDNLTDILTTDISGGGACADEFVQKESISNEISPAYDVTPDPCVGELHVDGSAVGRSLAELLTDLPDCDEIPPDSPFFHYMSPLSNEGPDEVLVDLIVFHKAPEEDLEASPACEDGDEQFYSLDTSRVQDDFSDDEGSPGIFHLTSPKEAESINPAVVLESPWISDNCMRSKIDREIQEISPLPGRPQFFDSNDFLDDHGDHEEESNHSLFESGEYRVDANNALDSADIAGNDQRVYLNSSEDIESEMVETSLSKSGIASSTSIVNISSDTDIEQKVIAQVEVESPITTKVRRVVTEEFAKILPTLESVRTHTKMAERPQSVNTAHSESFAVLERSKERERSPAWFGKPKEVLVEVTQAQCSLATNVPLTSSETSPPKNSRLAVVEKEVQALLARAGVTNNLQRSRKIQFKYPGKWKSFVDGETERISQIMMGKSKVSD